MEILYFALDYIYLQITLEILHDTISLHDTIDAFL